MADDEKTRWAIDVLTAWVDNSTDGDFVHERIAAYIDEPDGTSGLITGLVNLSGLLLSGMEISLGRSAPEILQTIAGTLSRSEAPPGSHSH